jgi:hypothetical protein
MADERESIVLSAQNDGPSFGQLHFLWRAVNSLEDTFTQEQSLDKLSRCSLLFGFLKMLPAYPSNLKAIPIP